MTFDLINTKCDLLNIKDFRKLNKIRDNDDKKIYENLFNIILKVLKKINKIKLIKN